MRTTTFYLPLRRSPRSSTTFPLTSSRSCASSRSALRTARASWSVSTARSGPTRNDEDLCRAALRAGVQVPALFVPACPQAYGYTWPSGKHLGKPAAAMVGRTTVAVLGRLEEVSAEAPQVFPTVPPALTGDTGRGPYTHTLSVGAPTPSCSPGSKR